VEGGAVVFGTGVLAEELGAVIWIAGIVAWFVILGGLDGAEFL
jgi:hypothetical protein